MLRKSLALSILVSILVLTVNILAAAQDTNTGQPSVVTETNALPMGKVDPNADIVFDLTPGTGAPPPTLGGYPMTPVPFPGAPACTKIMPPGPIPTPVAGSVIQVAPWSGQRCIGAGWASWSHGYKGDVYFTGGGPSQTITLPPGTKAFYMYVEPDPFAEHKFEVVADGVSSGPFTAHGSSGAKYVGAYNKVGVISSFQIKCITGVGFASGEYGWSGAVADKGAIAGTVKDIGVHPISQAFVLAVKLPTKEKASTKTDTTGAYKIPDLVPAYYFAICFKKGYQFDWKIVKVEAGKTTLVDFVLGPPSE